MKSAKQIKRRFLSLEKRARKLKIKYKALSQTEKMDAKGIILAQKYVQIESEKKGLFWTLDMYSKNRKNPFRERKVKTNKKKNDTKNGNKKSSVPQKNKNKMA